MAETLNMIEVPINTITDFIKRMISVDIYDPVIVLGKMGIGKTASIQALTKELGIGYCAIRLVNMTETDMLGIPTINSDGRTTYASNNLLPLVERDGEKGILVIDEITSCTDSMRAAAYQLLDCQRALGNYKLPDKWMCVALGNGPDDGGVFNGAEAALFTRCSCFRVATDLSDWKEYAIKSGVNPSVLAYLTSDPSQLHVFDPDELAGPCPCPRTWEALSTKLNAIEKSNNGNPVDMNTAKLFAASCVGMKAAGPFSGFYEYNKNGKAINPQDIVDGKADGTKINVNEPQVIYLAIQSLIRLLRDYTNKEDNPNYNRDLAIEKLGNAINWLIDVGSVRLDYAITGIRDLQSVGNNIVDLLFDDKMDIICPKYTEFCVENSIVVQ